MPSQEEELAGLHKALDECLATFDLAFAVANASLLEVSGNSRLSDEVDTKQFIMDSFKVNRAITTFKEWENSHTEDLFAEEFPKYTATQSELSRSSNICYQYLSENELLSESVKLPSFQFSYEALLRLGDDSLLSRFSDSSSPVHLSSLYSVTGKSNLPFPNEAVITKVINTEYRIRSEKRLKYDFTQAVKNQITSNNNKWLHRFNNLHNFLSEKLPTAINDVELIKSELEGDTKEEADDDDDDMEDDNDDDDDVEVQVDDEDDDEEVSNEDYQVVNEDELAPGNDFDDEMDVKANDENESNRDISETPHVESDEEMDNS